MTLEEKLIEYARSRDTGVYELDLPENRSVSTKLGQGCFIGIDKSRLGSEGERAVVLAHELGHCETDAFYCLYTPLVSRARLERKATVWAIEHLIPRDRLREALSEGIVEEWELAEHFGVTREFVRAAALYYSTGEVYLEI